MQNTFMYVGMYPSMFITLSRPMIYYCNRRFITEQIDRTRNEHVKNEKLSGNLHSSSVYFSLWPLLYLSQPISTPALIRSLTSSLVLPIFIEKLNHFLLLYSGVIFDNFLS